MIRVEADVSNGLPMFHMVGLSVFGSERGIRTGENSNPQFGDETSGKENHCQSCAGNCPGKKGHRLICRLLWRCWQLWGIYRKKQWNG